MLLQLIPFIFWRGSEKTLNSEIDSQLLRSLWFTRAHKDREPGVGTWVDDNTNFMVMCFTYIKRTVWSHLIEILGNNIELKIENILKIKQNCLRYAR